MCADRNEAEPDGALRTHESSGSESSTGAPKPRWWREPWVHFVALGGVLFAFDRMPSEPATESIVVRAGHVEELRTAILNSGKKPTPEAIQAEIDRFVDSEIMVREARHLGLDRGDMIIRRRLEQKMVFLVNDMADASPPTKDEMAAWLDEKRAEYRRPARFDVEHVYFARERRGGAAASDAAAALAQWRATGRTPVGDPFLRGVKLVKRTQSQLARALGQTFAKKVAEEEVEDATAWRGPVDSPYGYHLFRVTDRILSADPTLEEARARVRADMLDQRRRVAAGKAQAELRKKYTVEVEGRP